MFPTVPWCRGHRGIRGTVLTVMYRYYGTLELWNYRTMDTVIVSRERRGVLWESFSSGEPREMKREERTDFLRCNLM